MKQVFTLLALSAICTFSYAQDQVAVQEAMQLKETSFDFGKVSQGKPVYHFFEITNTSKEVIKLDDVSASCGCTTPEWSKDPIAPGATTKIKVGFNASSEGPFEKYITIRYNEKVTKQIKITGTVWKAPEGPAPLNASVQLLKQKNQ